MVLKLERVEGKWNRRATINNRKDAKESNYRTRISRIGEDYEENDLLMIASFKGLYSEKATIISKIIVVNGQYYKVIKSKEKLH
jgi:hypothetical protein